VQLKRLRVNAPRRALFLGALALAAGSLAAADALGAPAPSREMTFIEQENGLALVLQVEPAARDAGSFVFRVPGRGLYEGSVGAAMRVHSSRSITIDFEGAALLRPRVNPEEPAAAQRPRSATIRLQAQVDPVRREAQATLREGDLSFHLNTHRGPSGVVPRQTLEAFETALLASDWSALHALANRDLRAAYTPAAFAAQSEAEAARVGRIVGLRRLSVSDPQSNDAGARWVVVGYAVQVRSPGGALSESLYDAFFIPELREWKLWYTAAR